ncbi:MAG: DUF362 domain-containing protein [Bryobacteraceae bacterium]
MTRREWLSLIASAPLLNADTPPAPAAPVSIVPCASYDEDVTAKLTAMFAQLGGLERLVRNKTVTIKLNLTGGPRNRLGGVAPALTHWVHPKVIGATAYLMGRAGAKRIRIVESAGIASAALEDGMQAAEWDVHALGAAASGVEFENTNGLGKSKSYARFKVPGTAHMYPEYVLNRAYDETDVFVSMAKLKNHADCGVTLSIKNCFGNLPCSIYGGDAGVDEPNEGARQGREAVGHLGRRQPAKIAPPELHPGVSSEAGYRVSRIVADVVAARPIHLAIIDGVESMAGGEGPWIRGVRSVKPGVLLAGWNPVCTDAVATAVMGYNPVAMRGTAPFRNCDNTMLLAEQLGVGTTDLKRIEVRGVTIEQAMYRFEA